MEIGKMYFIKTDKKFKNIKHFQLKNSVINLDFVESIDEIYEGDLEKYGILFEMNSGKEILWLFSNAKDRDEELQKIYDSHCQE